ncbi:MAG TPA: hypothetical protein VH583_25905 [Vicinamibacterales bacterium]|jgi:hypothetical protein
MATPAQTFGTSLIIGVLTAAAPTAAPERMRLNVVVQNSVGLPEADIRQAEVIAARVYREIGIDIAWFNPGDPAPTADEAERIAFCRSVIRLDLVDADVEKTARPKAALGVAFPQARFAWVMVGRIREDQASASGLVPLPNRIGLVIAHELGHLLGYRKHAVIGLMAPHINWYAVLQDCLWFTKTEAALIREGLVDAMARRDALSMLAVHP